LRFDFILIAPCHGFLFRAFQKTPTCHSRATHQHHNHRHDRSPRVGPKQESCQQDIQLKFQDKNLHLKSRALSAGRNSDKIAGNRVENEPNFSGKNLDRPKQLSIEDFSFSNSFSGVLRCKSKRQKTAPPAPLFSARGGKVRRMRTDQGRRRVAPLQQLCRTRGQVGLGVCNFATHVKASVDKQGKIKVNPLKASKRAARGR
jgi:hypothetical protein